MKKLYCKISCLFVCLVFFSVTAIAEFSCVFDEAGLFTAEEATQLESDTSALSGELAMDFVIVTTNDAQEKTSQEYADDYFDEKAFGTGEELSGALFLIDMDNRMAWISTSGKMIDYLTDDRINTILDTAYEGLSSGNYNQSANAFLDGVRKYVSEGVTDEHYRYDTETGETSPGLVEPNGGLTAVHILIFAIISVVVGGVCCGIVYTRYRINFSHDDYVISDKSHMNMTHQQDIFLNKNVITRHIPPPSNNSGGGGSSSTHTSSSGNTHGGGGRSF